MNLKNNKNERTSKNHLMLQTNHYFCFTRNEKTVEHLWIKEERLWNKSVKRKGEKENETKKRRILCRRI